MKYILWTLRILIGVLFIFSGLLKANDPMGLVYKMDEFFEVWNMNFMTHYTLTFSVIMITFEVLCGVAVLIGYSFRIFATLLLLLNLFFTFLTGYAFFSGKVKECGCFGACIKISNSATFYKDIVLLVLSFILFVYRGRISGLFSKYVNTSIIILTVVSVAVLQWWVLEHLPFAGDRLPFKDCLPYKAGNNILEKMQPGPDYKPAVITSVFIYEKNGQKKEFTMENYPWQDSTWKFVDRKDKVISEAIGEPELHDFILTDTDGNDQTQNVLKAKGYAFFWFVREFDKARMDNIGKLKNLIAKANALHIPFYALCSADKESSRAFLQKWNLNVPLFTLDFTASKTALRSNPGLMLLNDGTVMNKWSYRDYPADVALDNGKINIK
jgi:uncharacterized membrane protein YphA (DoxX/SURF4 family)